MKTLSLLSHCLLDSQGRSVGVQGLSKNIFIIASWGYFIEAAWSIQSPLSTHVILRVHVLRVISLRAVSFLLRPSRNLTGGD